MKLITIFGITKILFILFITISSILFIYLKFYNSINTPSGILTFTDANTIQDDFTYSNNNFITNKTNPKNTVMSIVLNPIIFNTINITENTNIILITSFINLSKIEINIRQQSTGIQPSIINNWIVIDIENPTSTGTMFIKKQNIPIDSNKYNYFFISDINIYSKDPLTSSGFDNFKLLGLNGEISDSETDITLLNYESLFTFNLLNNINFDITKGFNKNLIYSLSNSTINIKNLV
jgi:hypothetical protein